MDRKLIDYLPLYVQKYREMKQIMGTEQVAVESAWTDTENALADQFIQDATEDGITRYEKLLGITPKATYTLDERKFTILARLNEQLPYTIAQLHSSLTSLCGEGGYYLKIDTDNYTLTVKVALYNQNNVETIADLLYKMIPANMVKNVFVYNTNAILKGYTHEQLSSYTHKALREEVL